MKNQALINPKSKYQLSSDILQACNRVHGITREKQRPKSIIVKLNSN